MKKALLLTLALIVSIAISAQNRATFVDETFDGSSLPEGWTTSEIGAANWGISSTTYSGGSGKELKLSWTPEFNGTTRLITTAFNLSSISDVTVSFKHLFDNFKDGQTFHTIGIATSSDGETWNIGWSQEYTITGVYEINEVITTSDMGKDNVRFCLYYEGDSHNMDNWFFDDLHIFKQTELDLKLSSIDIPNIVEAGEKEITFTVENLGVQPIETFEAEINVSNWETPLKIKFNQNIAPSETKQIVFNDNMFSAEASRLPYEISIEIMSVNDKTDHDISNNHLEKKVVVAFNKAQRIPMIEHFSSSTCGPCVAVNQQMHPLMLANEGKFAYTKFPTAGDPYHTNEAAHKVKEYNVTGVPNIFLDGINKGSNYLTQEMLDERYNTPAYADIRGAFNMNGNIINITADFMSYINLNNVKAFITINETTTEKNTGSNGETEFHHILMKMLESEYGNTVSIKAGKYHRYEFSYDMSATHVEELDDIEVALWLQDSVTKEIYNSRFAYAYSEHCYPVYNMTLNKNENKNILTWEKPEKGNPIGYRIFINGKLAVENTTELSYEFTSSDERLTAEVTALYENGKTSVGVAILFGAEDEEIEAPSNFAATAKSISSIELSWNEVNNAQKYNIYRDDEKINETTATNYTDENLEYDTRYCYTVTAVVNGIESEHSEKICVKTLGENIEETSSSFNIYPNPADEKIYIETDVNVLGINIYNINGQRVNESTSQRVIDVTGLKKGIYLIKIETENGNIVRRFVKN